LVLSRVRLIRVRVVLVNLNPINDTYISFPIKTPRPGSSTLGQVERFSWTDPLFLTHLFHVDLKTPLPKVLDPLDPRRPGDPLLPVPLDPLVPT